MAQLIQRPLSDGLVVVSQPIDGGVIVFIEVEYPPWDKRQLARGVGDRVVRPISQLLLRRLHFALGVRDVGVVAGDREVANEVPAAVGAFPMTDREVNGASRADRYRRAELDGVS